jgi:hypothetical protein
VGPPASRNISYSPDVVIVLAKGGTASTWNSLALGPSANLGCHRAARGPRRVSAVVVRFNAHSTFTVALPRGRGEVCTKIPVSSVGYVIAGSSGLAQN